ncbi:hypothetical protein ACROYT_G009934 [Oculina patagonica]
MFKENVGKKQAGGLITTSNPPLIGSPTTALLPSAALPISTSTGMQTIKKRYPLLSSSLLSSSSPLSSSPPPPPSSSSSLLLADLIENACLRAHNERRALHGASPLVWDDALVQSAQVWADHLAATGQV